MLIALAWKNIWRNKKRSTIIILAAAFGLWGGIYSSAIWMGMAESMVEMSIDRDLGHIQIHNKGFLDNININNYIENPDDIVNSLKENPLIEIISKRVLFEGMAASPTSSMGIQIVGVDTTTESQISSINENIIAGSYFGTNKRNEILVGKKLAERLKLKLKSKLVISFQSVNGDIHYEACRIVGIFKTAATLFDQGHIFIKQSDLQRILGKNISHEIVIRTVTAKDMFSVYDEVVLDYPDLDIKSWRQLAPELAYTSSVMEIFTYFFVGIILFALLFGIINTMLMSVLDRTKELGMLLSIGMAKLKVFSLILLETVFLSITGGIVGLLISFSTIAYSYNTGLDFSYLSESLGSFGASTMIYPFLPLHMYIILFIMIMFTAIIAAIMPAVKAIKLRPAEAIRTY